MTKQASNGFRTILFQLMTDPARSGLKQSGPEASGANSARFKPRS